MEGGPAAALALKRLQAMEGAAEILKNSVLGLTENKAPDETQKLLDTCSDNKKQLFKVSPLRHPSLLFFNQLRSVCVSDRLTPIFSKPLIRKHFWRFILLWVCVQASDLWVINSDVVKMQASGATKFQPSRGRLKSKQQTSCPIDQCLCVTRFHFYPITKKYVK